jgi:hypothetical protein
MNGEPLTRGLCWVALAGLLVGCTGGDPSSAQRRDGSIPHRFVDRAAGLAVRTPAGWQVDQRPLTSLISPRQLLVISSFPMRERRPDPNCASRTAISELPPTGALLLLLEQPSAANESGAHALFGKRPNHFHLERLRARPHECFGIARGVDFQTTGREIYLLAYFGPKASQHMQHLADRVLDSLVLQPASKRGSMPRHKAALVGDGVLAGDGIGSVRFGRPHSVVTAELARLLGTPHETIPGICGFGRSTDWIGLNINSDVANLSAELNLSFKHSRFVGYAYYANAEGPARQRHGVLLAPTSGLTLGDTVGRARHLYGRAFIETSVPQGTPPSAKLPRLPVGEVSTTSGEISAGIQGFGRLDRVSAHSTVVSIGAGAGPNTPCH